MGLLKKTDMTPEIRKLLGLPSSNGRQFTKDDVRGYALRCLAPLAGLTRCQRSRVLQQAVKINQT